MSPRAKSATPSRRQIETYEHRDKQRVNNPPAGLVTPDNDPDTGQKKRRYAYDPHLDPQLVWAGKAEHISFEVPTVSLHVHERIDPKTIIETVRKKNGQPQPVQLGLFEEERKEPLHEAIQFYQHKHDWSNRLIAGDSLLVMNSLLEKEGLAGKVQMIYIDPPYGIKYGSNFQPFVNKRDVKDGRDEDLTAEPEQIKAFRDTWELGIHSYLTYLRDRLLLARELLTESGSIFVQISDENVHHVRELMDEVFGAGNFVNLIAFRTHSPLGVKLLPNPYDYLIWYSKDKSKLKYRPLYVYKDSGEGTQFTYIEMKDGARRSMTRDERQHPELTPEGARVFRLVNLPSSGYTESCTFDFMFEGQTYKPSRGRSWKTTLDGMQRLVTARRVYATGTYLNYVYFLDDFPLSNLSGMWADVYTELDKQYVVQTGTKVIERCLLMTTDPGDLVFDPTCGSGTTAYVAEQWGRRWITCDTSRVAITLAKQRLMTAVFDYYELAHPNEGVGSGFKYKTVPHVTLKSIANNPEIDGIYARMHPAIEKALAELNAALKGRPIKFKVTQGGRAGQFVDFAAPDSATFTLPAGQVVKVNELVEWEVPFEFPTDWPDAARHSFEAFHAARRAMQNEMDAAIARLIINSPYEEPQRHWRYDRNKRTFELVEGRRPAGYVVATPGSESFDDPGNFVEIGLVNQIRPRVKAWREAGYPGVTSITKRLLEHWRDPEEFETRRFFFCQLEAVETLIWLTEAPAAERVGIEIPGDGGAFVRQCCKMATGTGKTIVMAMVIAWQVLNKVASPQDARFSKNVLVIAPGLTVKKRLAVLELSAEGNYYEAFDIVPSALLDKLRQGKVLVRNWHALAWESEEQIQKRKSVDKRGVKSDESYTREVLGEMANARNILVINDEAHHAWRVNPEAVGKYMRQRDLKDSAAEATVWIGGLDRLNRTRGILKCYDFSATPFAPSGKRSGEETLFGWIVSDFGLNDAIESGLVKTPRVVIRDDAVPDTTTYKSQLYSIYNTSKVKSDLNRRAKPEEPLPDLVLNAYHLLGYDWREAWKAWRAAGQPTPPVMITVANRTETAARVKHAFDTKRIYIDELCDPERVLHIDSKVLDEAEARDEPAAADAPEEEEGEAEEETATSLARKLTKAEQAERLRRTVDTVGKVGQPGEKIQNVISVGMLSEGWDVKTVTHIMGLRAFTSQLLCEQVVGRGLRRTSYELNPETGLFDPRST